MLRARRCVFALLVVTTMLAAFGALTVLLMGNGLSVVDVLILTSFAITLPWTVIGFWNSVIGLLLSLGRGEAWRAVVDLRGLDDPERPLRSRTALVMPVYDEDPDLFLRHLQAIIDDLHRTGGVDGFELFLLSDTQQSDLIVAEAEAVARFTALNAGRIPFVYRRRPDNVGYKTGNLWDFIDRHGDKFDHMIVLDADSLMSAAAIRRLVRLIEVNPRVGILQTLITGLPSDVPFPRLFQYGMRHGMRAYTLGSAWWQGPAGPYWGHNAVIRLDAFRAHCRLPHLPGRPPLGGQVLSHDQLEAVQMRRGGYDVCVLADEFGSYEINPPALPEFLRRDLRWCQGNLQYLKLVGAPGWHLMGRVQLALAILMYLSPPAWFALMIFSFVQGAVGIDGGTIVATPLAVAGPELGLGLLIVMLTMVHAPKLAGTLDALIDRRRRASYGGGFRLVGSATVELVHGMLLAPIMALSETLFIGRMIGGHGLAWRAQRRSGSGVAWAEAFRRFWPHTLFGTAMLVGFLTLAPTVVLLALPVIAGLLGAIAFTCFTSRRRFGHWLVRHGVATLPEERVVPRVVADAVPWIEEHGPRDLAARPVRELAPAPSGGD
ncbi:MAG: glucans biosynthesis glucosyltransferase MdoH [Pseudomonadota bacterium]